MSRKRFIIIDFFLLAITLMACQLGDLVSDRATPTPTPTILVARFTTLTPTTTPAATATTTPTQEITLTPTLPPTRTASLTPQLSPTFSGGQDSPVATPSPQSDTSTMSDRLIQPPTATPSPTITPRPAPPATATSASPPPLSGRIAFPIDDGQGQYDIWMVELPKGEPFLALRRARQPNFSASGQLLVNNENSSNGENLGLLDTNNTWLGLVSDTPEDRHPFWNPEGDRYVFVNAQLLTDPLTQQYLTYLFIPCSVRRPLEENTDSCRDTGGKSKLVPGDYPVWTADYRIAYFYNQQGQEGIYLVSARATPREHAADAEPQRLIAAFEARPTDSHGNRLYFSTASLDQNWEAYAINLDGSGLVNLSNSPETRDGLPAISPDGAWVAFVSDRNEHWGIWIVSSSGGTPFELVDLSKINTINKPWGTDDRDWTNERITWGP